MPEDTLENSKPVEMPAEQTPAPAGEPRLVPVAEAIKYRRRAQQAESHAKEFEQQLQELQSQLQQQNDDLATAEAQRDEVRTQLTVTENRLAAERLLGEAGVIDLDTASMLLSKRVDFAEEIDADKLTASVEELLLDKPFLRAATGGSLPPKTASARSARITPVRQLTNAAERAARSGSRKDVAEYLRLRRQTSVAT